VDSEISIGEIVKPAACGAVGWWLFGKQRPLILIAWIAGVAAIFGIAGIWALAVHGAMLPVNLIRWVVRQPSI
jgi:hypothetical protein